MLKTFEPITAYLKFNELKVSIDNLFFKLHYRVTFILLIIATVLVTSRQYIGEHIKCIAGTIPENVINTFCFVQTTFTVVRQLNNSALDSGAIFQPGIGPYHFEQEPIKRHAYYQWVPFVLFGQALCFLVPHLIWKNWEGGRIKKLVFGFKMFGRFSRYNNGKSFKIGKYEIPTADETEQRIRFIRNEMIKGLELNRRWGTLLLTAEFMNLFNICLQIWLTDKFLSGQFFDLGVKIYSENWNNKMDILDIVFPKVTKCHFHKYGPSGSLQVHDTLCVMALNIINEKIYTILWFWFLFLFVMSAIAVTWRITSLFFFKSKRFSEFAFAQVKPGKGLNRNNLHTVIERCSFSNWMFLYFMAANMPEKAFNKVIYHLADEISPNPQSENTTNQQRDVHSPVASGSLDTVDGAPLLEKDR